ncbi:unnamed protein product [Ixodes pacificus]
MARSNHHADGLPATRTRSLAEDGLCETPLRNNSVPSSQVRTRNSSRLSAYLLALRPWSFSASFAPVALGAALAYKVSHEFSPLVFVTTCVTALSVHAAGNVVNTYFDYMRGVDDSKRSDDRILVDKILTPDEVVHLGVLLYTVGCAGFILLVSCSPARMEHLALVYFGGLSSSFLYTGGHRPQVHRTRGRAGARDVRARVRALLICGPGRPDGTRDALLRDAAGYEHGSHPAREQRSRPGARCAGGCRDAGGAAWPHRVARAVRTAPVRALHRVCGGRDALRGPLAAFAAYHPADGL